MPGVITMEPGGQNGTRTDHDRDFGTNGVNGVDATDSRHGGLSREKAVAAPTPTDDTSTAKDASRRLESDANGVKAEQSRNRMNDLPDEIVHITQGFVPLSLLLTRLAQTTHNALEDKIAELAKMPVPATTMNGTSSSYSSSGPDDTSAENLRKKGALLHFAQEWHGKWLKALVIAEWSRQSPQVSKLIDLKYHIDQQRMLFDAALDNIVNVKRDLTFARMPSPDLKTALQVLSTGSAPWMPDLHYIEPPALTAEEQLKWMGDLNTLLSLRLNLDDFDKIPPQFRDYEIGSGRVTFKVDGEFEVDLTIADEDFEKQFWFIDFRYAFKPAASRLPNSLRSYLEAGVNDSLGREGLQGCYQFLHGFVLTTKIHELRRQALQLSRSSWTGTLNVEPLNRALAIQYWTSRSNTTGSKSWVLVAVNSNRKPNGKHNVNASSQLVAKWYRDGKEVNEVPIDFNVDELSTESLLTNVIARHVEYILSNIHSKLLMAARFQRQEAGIVLRISKTDPASSVLTTQVGCSGKVSLLIEPMTGVFAVKPQSKFTIQPERQLNDGKIPADDGVNCLEHVRCAIMEEEVHRRGTSMGWNVRKAAMTMEELRLVVKMRDWTRAIWLQKDGWGSSWFVVVVLSLSGDEWWLLESKRNDGSRTPRLQTKMPLNNGYPELTDTFWNNLAFLTTGLIAQSIDMRELHRQRIKSESNYKPSSSASLLVQLPSIDIALSDLFPAMAFHTDDAKSHTSVSNDSVSEDDEDYEKTDMLSLIQQASGITVPIPKKAWAENIVNISFKGIQSLAPTGATNGDGSQETELICVSEAIIQVRNLSKFSSLSDLADRDVSYDPQRGQFSLRFQRAVGKPVLDTLKSRIMAIDRFVNFLEVMDSAKGTITTESVTLRQSTFYYGGSVARGQQDDEVQEMQSQKQSQEAKTTKRWRVVLDLSRGDIDIEIEKGNPHLQVVDLMRQLVNSDGGISGLMSWLVISLQALQAIGKMDSQWEPLRAAGLGGFEFSMKTIAWMNIDYWISTGPNEQSRKTVSLDVKMRPRRSQAWWHVWRSDADADAESQDAVSRALQPVWDGKGEGWLGLATGAAGLPEGGVVAMLLAVDEAIRTSVTDGSADNSSSSSSGSNNNKDVVVLD
ncbi:hypothetical protein C2857_001507 [Epichloe festucae Fl1]|uniref:Mediator of RNA polymerase II transcription subunit 14 n=1 Tax=Epichloe festucae (strain Fl1) TaxID=877507 RepID=A0A7S9PVA1_EPIFF|nr:hypothetical protein C2857_001507 [Epichloe festucae Fl1]